MRANGDGSSTGGGNGNGGGPTRPPVGLVPDPPRRKPKLKKLRFAFILLGVSVLAVISTVFGMLMAVASDLPSLEGRAQYEAAENSLLYQAGPGCREPGHDRCLIAKLTGNENRILVQESDISPNLKNAVIAIEDRRFYEHEGVDYAGIARALVQDVVKRSAAQGGSTITQQFVKNALSAQGNRTVFQKLRESALAYHLERQWSKSKILTQYLNTVYFGHGAYGIEAATRTYFGDGDEFEETEEGEALGYTPYGVDEEGAENPDLREARDVAPEEAALLAGLIASPSLYDPIENPQVATQRRNLVLQRMLEQGMITRPQYEYGIKQAVPTEDDVDPPDTDSEQPYFTSWMTQQLVDKYGATRVFGGGLKIKTTIDPELQAAAEQAIAGRLSGIGPDASLVAIENKTGRVRAMVGGTDFDARPFNLATNGHRQPGSSFKPFILLRALEDGIDPNSTWASQPVQLPFKGEKGPELFEVHNYEDSYLGSASLWSATAASDNSVFAQLGMKVKPKRVAALANEMGIRTELSTNPAMLLGGLEIGVTPLEMAYAFSTLANDGIKVTGSENPNGGPVAFEKWTDDDGHEVENRRVAERVFPKKVGELAREMLSLVVTSGTGKAAQVGDEYIWGKTGTTENYGDAWFAGGNEDISVAVWVGYADKVQPMEYEHAGGPVAGGTFPAEIFQDFMTQFIEIEAARDAEREARRLAREGDDETLPAVPVTPSEVPPAEQVAPPETVPVEPDTGGETPEAEPLPEAPAPQEPAPTPEPVPTPTPTPPTPPPSDGGDTGGGVGAAPG